MSSDSQLKDALKGLSNEKINIIIETGTYIGTGSSRIISESFIKSKSIEVFYTIEINYNNFLQAKRNLKNYKFVRCLYGSSLLLSEAINFIRNDDAILNHKNYENIFIDDTNDPISFYTREMEGLLNENKKTLGSLFLKKKENLLPNLILNNIDKSLFIVLDSAGGVGYLEFLNTYNLLKEKTFYILLDDIHHLKHFRSYRDIQYNKKFSILYENYAQG